ncbi:MAG: hypothetical protein ABSD42_02485 [Candidatus Bathyarchaeia archaeon]
MKKIESPTQSYQCEKCGNTYPTVESAALCESNPISQFKYEIGDTVYVEFTSHMTQKHLKFSGVVESRWIKGLPKNNWSPHENMYKIRSADMDKGLILVRSENQIFAKL